ncbi:MAG: radical SAM protein [Chloroherpetonaceae bacterium]|nr:radical SAM protein [Chloroherpetonaceae bacterium]
MNESPNSIEVAGVETLGKIESDASLSKTYSVAHSSADHTEKPSPHLPFTFRQDLEPIDSIKPLKLLFITPKGKKEEDTSQKALFSMAIGVLVSITPKQHHIEIVDELFGDEIPYDKDFDLIGLTARTMNVTRAYDIADEFRRRGKKVLIGGVHVSFNYDEAKQHVDSVVCGEAENLWAYVIQDASRGVLRARYDAKEFPPVKEVPVLDYERIFSASKRGKVDARKSIPIYMTRGCPYTCSFCVTPNFTGRLYRIQSQSTIKEQVESAKKIWFETSKYGTKPWFMFTDENLGVNKQRMYEILEVLETCDIKFSTFISMNFLEDVESVRRLVRAGCVMALVGFESVNQATVDQYDKWKMNTVGKYSEIIRNCRKEGLNVQGNFLTNPAIDTYEDMAAVEKFVSENYLMMPIYSILTPYPGTQMYREYKAKGLIVDEDWDKYTAHNLVIRCDKFDPLEFQVRYMKHFINFYKWSTIFKRVFFNPEKMINLVTSLIFKRNLKDQLRSIENGKKAPIQKVKALEVQPLETI